MMPMLPREIVRREKKFGFSAPQPEWFARPNLIAALEEALCDGTISRAPVERRKYAATLTRGKAQGFTWEESNELWNAYSLAIWNDVFVTRGRATVRDAAAV